MKRTLVLLNLASAAAMLAVGYLIGALHRVHRYSTYSELVSRKAVVKVAPSSPDDPVGHDGAYDVAKRLQQIGASSC
jgi:hypothetical protein